MKCKLHPLTTTLSRTNKNHNRNISATLYHGVKRNVAQGNKSCETLFPHRAKEVTTDGADVVRQLTDIQY